MIRARHIELQHALLRHGSSFEGMFFESIVLVLWFTVVVGLTIWAYRKRALLRLRERAWTYWRPVMCVLAAVFIPFQSMSLIDYTQTCDVPLHRS